MFPDGLNKNKCIRKFKQGALCRMHHMFLVLDSLLWTNVSCIWENSQNRHAKYRLLIYKVLLQNSILASISGRMSLWQSGRVQQLVKRFEPAEMMGLGKEKEVNMASKEKVKTQAKWQTQAGRSWLLIEIVIPNWRWFCQYNNFK